MDFLFFKENWKGKNNNILYLEPSYEFVDSKDIIIKGSKVYAMYDEEKKVWKKEKTDFAKLMDRDLKKEYARRAEQSKNSSRNIILANDFKFDTFSNTSSGFMKSFNQSVKEYEDVNPNVDLDGKIIFKNTDLTREDYSTGRLNYSIEEGSTEAWDALAGTLYNPEEKEKIEWMIGSIISGYSKIMQKFFVFYGAPGTGKSTILHIIEAMFPNYFAPFMASRVVSSSEFALDSLANNPLIAIQHDGDLSKVIDNSALNSVVSHETMKINEKNKTPYSMTFRCLLLLGTNEPVKLNSMKSGMRRRLIDIQPSGIKIPSNEFHALENKIKKFERGALAYKCLQVFNTLGEDYYIAYRPKKMEDRTNEFKDFVSENYELFEKQNFTFGKQVYELYTEYIGTMGGKKILSRLEIYNQIEDYFEGYKPKARVLINGQELTVNKYWYGFKKELFSDDNDIVIMSQNKVLTDWLDFSEYYGSTVSKLDIFLKDNKAQYANKDGIPSKRWDNVTTRLNDLETNKLHYVQAPEELIVIDFDIKNEKGEKDFELNKAAASEFPKTYAELSKSGAGIHLHYLYSGDVSELSRIFDDDIEIKIFTGNASLRRQLTKFNNESIAKISDGLPLKKKKGGKMFDKQALQTEKSLRKTIIRCLRNEIHGHHKPNMDFIYKILTDAYNNKVQYDLTDMYNDILSYAMSSSSKSDYCIELLAKMPLKSDEPSDAKDEPKYDDEGEKIVFFDVEVWPNLFIFGFKYLGGEKHILMNPKPEDVEWLVDNPQIKLIGFNCRKYDNHIVRGFLMGYTNKQLYEQSQKIVKAKKGDRKDNGLLATAYDLSYTDIYDFSKKKQSLKKWEIELGIYHKEMDASWDEPLPEDKWEEAKIYNGYDLDATEALWLSKGIQVDFTSRMILADIAGGKVNDTDNTLTERLILGPNFNERKAAKNSFYYRDLAKPVYHLDPDQKEFLQEVFPEMLSTTHGQDKSLLPYFPGYTFDKYTKTSMYKGEEIGEGGLVRAIPGVYGYAKTFDVTSMHPHSLAAEYYFGKYTEGYYNLVRARIAIKHNDMEFLGKLFEGKLLKYCTDDDQKKKLSTALKTPINAVYGLTAAGFDNNLRHPDNIDNIVAKRGALFMMDLRDAVLAQGYQIFHIKTDSLKVINPDEYIEKFILDFGKRYGYSFEVEHEFEKICLVNDAVYIAKVTENDADWKKEAKKAAEKGEPEPTRWTATGAQFQVPYIFKTLFSKENITFDDLCVIKNVSKGALYLDYNEGLEDVSKWELLKDLRSEVKDKTILIDWEVAKSMDWTKRDMEWYNMNINLSDEELEARIAVGHNRNFIGKVGNFCPIREGYGGAELVCLNEQGKFVSPAGCKDVRWLEAEYVKSHNMEDKIDYDYFENMCQEAINDISQYDPNFFE